MVLEDHPFWRSVDDDDWNGRTAEAWLTTLAGKSVVARPPAALETAVRERGMSALRANAQSVEEG